MQSDAELVRLAVKGDTEAFGELYRRHAAGVNAFARRIVASQSADVVQETFLTAYLSLKRLRDHEAFPSWLFGIALNLCRQALRADMADERLASRLSGGSYRNGVSPGPDEILMAEYEASVIRKAVAELPPALRKAVQLRYLQSLTISETSAVLGISESATKTRLHRARRRLRSRLAGHVTKRRARMKKVEILDVLSEGIVLFLDWEGARAFPIFMSKDQVNSIAIGLKGTNVGRPMTFQFMTDVLNHAEVKIEWVCISELKESTFYAKVHLAGGTDIDARPSDAVNLAIAVGAPVYADEKILENIGIEVPIDKSKRRTYETKGLDTLIEELKSQMAIKMRQEGIVGYIQSLFSSESKL